jgi:hypothetical protein
VLITDSIADQFGLEAVDERPRIISSFACALHVVFYAAAPVTGLTVDVARVANVAVIHRQRRRTNDRRDKPYTRLCLALKILTPSRKSICVRVVFVPLPKMTPE